MNLLQFDNNSTLAECAAKLTIDRLKSAISEFGDAVWVLAGGNTPMTCYEVISNKYVDLLDWQKVWFLMGDERHVNTEHSDSNWGAIEEQLLSKLNVSVDHLLPPAYSENLEEMAKNYSASLYRLPANGNGRPRLDVVWLGIGEDGHSLSLFPGNDLSMTDLVMPVSNSPKPPSERISLTLFTLAQARYGLVLATGEAKANAVKKLVDNDMAAPVAQAVEKIESREGTVYLLVDRQAGSLIDN